MTTTHPTCTVRFAVTGLCGKTAVYTLPGGRFHECAEHFAGTVEGPATLAPGTPVRVTVHGTTKVGRLVATTPTKARVLVPTYGGKAERVVTLPLELVEVLT